MEKLFVSCVMPTKGRRGFIPAAIDCWRRQTYKNRELVILDEGPGPIGDLVPANNGSIRYFYQDSPVTTGTKRNLVNALADGEIIAHFDDDDFSMPGRLAYQVELLLGSAGKVLTGFSRLWFWDEVNKRALFYGSQNPAYVVGTSFCYFKSLWQEHPFKDKQLSSDNDFIRPLYQKLAVSKEIDFMVARIHNGHTNPKDNIKTLAKMENLPPAFWENEKLVSYD